MADSQRRRADKLQKASCKRVAEEVCQEAKMRRTDGLYLPTIRIVGRRKRKQGECEKQESQGINRRRDQHVLRCGKRRCDEEQAL